MKDLLYITFNKILSIYNYDLKEYELFEEKDVKVQTKEDNILFDYNNTTGKIIAHIVVGKKDNSTKYGIIFQSNNRKFPYIEFISKECLKVLRALYFSYNKIINKAMVRSIIDETIENSIVQIAFEGLKNSSFRQKRLLINRVCELLQHLLKWSNRTYEGRKIPFSFLIDLKEIEEGSIFEHFNEFLKDDASALLTDGITSYLEIGKYIVYRVVDFFDAEKVLFSGNSSGDNEKIKIPLVPYRFSSFGNVCEDGKLGVILTVQGDLLFIKNRKLMYAKRNGEWHFYDYDAFNKTLFDDMNDLGVYDKDEREEKIKKIYLTCLDVAFARTGGCLAICKKDQLEELKKNIHPDDIHLPFRGNNIIENDVHYKRYFLEDIIINKGSFDSLSRKARQELLGIDGATIISTEWKFITTGAIIDNQMEDNQDRHGGARTKIAMKLSDYGIAIKISADGYIECYREKKHIF